MFFFQNIFSRHSIAKTFLLKNFQQHFQTIFFPLQLTKNYKNSLLKNHRYGIASREKTVIAVWRKISEVIEKSSVSCKKNSASIACLVPKL
jgi:hypothetical protein